MVVDNLAVKVTSFETMDMLPFESAREPDGMYIVVTMEIENRGKEPKSLNVNNFALSDIQHRIFMPSLQTLEYADGLSLEVLNPGLTRTGTIVFDVPRTVLYDKYTVLPYLLEVWDVDDQRWHIY